MKFRHLPSHAKFRPGQKVISERFLNGLAESAIPALVGGPGVRISEFGKRVSVNVDQQDAPNFPVLRYASVIEEFDDYLLVAPFVFDSQVPQQYDDSLGADKVLDANGDVVSDPTNQDPTLFYAAKPYDLQKTPWDGKTVDIYGANGKFAYTGIGKRNMTLNSNSFPQQITQPYFPGDILALQFGNTGYALADTKQVEVTDPDTGVVTIKDESFTRYIEWSDINAGGRNWGGVGASGEIVRLSDGTSSVMGATVIEFDSPDLWTISNPNAGVARVSTQGFTGIISIVTGCTGNTLNIALISIKRGLITNVQQIS